ncbi:MAG: FeoB-associated Cys-rich membrane protein [Tissierellia bacterium]|nr:FeoB-associated Cys-rich membrane protein [Tissierellia bacterium]
MIALINQYRGDILVGALLLLALGLILRKIFRDRRAGNSSCGCGCSKCPSSGICHKPQDK